MNLISKKYLSVVIIILGFSSFSTAQNIAGSDKYIFKTGSVTIGPSFPNPELCYYWEPKELLDYNNIPNPKANVPKTTSFGLTVTGKDFSTSQSGSMTVHYIKVEDIISPQSYACQGSKVKITAKLTDDIALPNGWSLSWTGSKDVEIAAQDGLSATVIFHEPNGAANIKACITGSKDTVELNILVVGFELRAYPRNVICDGNSVQMYISPLPEGISVDYLNCFSDFKITSELPGDSYGNPAGTTTLKFTPVDAYLKFEVENAFWYSTVQDHCNVFSDYRLWASARNENGDPVKSTIPYIFEVYAGSECLNGHTFCCDQYFNSQLPDIALTETSPGVWTAAASKGFLERKVRISSIEIDADSHSQYFDMISQEEEYHQKQFEGTVPSACYDQVFIVDNIINSMNAIVVSAPSSKEAYAMAVNNFIICRDGEIERSRRIKQSKFCRCNDEKDAKAQFVNPYNAALECTYPSCLDPNPN